jgi:hypothetical protein
MVIGVTAIEPLDRWRQFAPGTGNIAGFGGLKAVNVIVFRRCSQQSRMTSMCHDALMGDQSNPLLSDASYGSNAGMAAARLACLLWPFPPADETR